MLGIYRISMRMKLFIALFPLLLALCWFAGSGMKTRIHTERQMDVIVQLTAIARGAGDVVHELQKERGMSAGYLGSGGGQFRTELADQRKLTDAAMAKFSQRLSQTDSSALEGIDTSAIQLFNDQTQLLSEVRNNVSNLKSAAPQAIGFYTKTIAQVLDFVGGIGHLTTSGKIGQELSAYYSLLNLKEQSGIERALLSGIFSSDRFGDGQFRQLSDVVGKQEAWLSATRRFSTAEQAAALDGALRSTSATDALKYREIALDKVATGGFKVNPTDWFKAQTVRIGAASTRESNR